MGYENKNELQRFSNPEEAEVIDPQDDPSYWNDPSRLLNDTTRATKEDVLKDPLAGYVDQDTGDPATVASLCEFLAGHGVNLNGRVLDWGCGGGRMSLIWREMLRSYGMTGEQYILDHAEDAVEVARIRLGLPHKRCAAVDGDRIDVFGVRFDTIFTHTALQHNSGWKQRKILAAMHSALSRGGHLFLWNEKTFSSEEGITSAFYHDDRGSAGTAAHWICHIARFGFELLNYDNSRYLFRRM